jgi:hypothetical protein
MDMARYLADSGVFFRPWDFRQCQNEGILNQCCGSGSALDPDSKGSLDPDPQSGSGSRRGKMTHKNRIFFFNFLFLIDGCSLLRAEGFSCSLVSALLRNRIRIRIQIQAWEKNPDLE